MPPPSPRPVVHRDAQGRLVVERTHESLAERLIREAQERGEFDNLPGHGRSLAVGDNPYAGELGLAFHVLRNAGVAPGWIEADKEARALGELRDELLAGAPNASPARREALRRRIVQIVDAHRRAVTALNAQAPTARQHRRPMVLEEELAAFEHACRPTTTGAGS
jgi:hypothetical protein